MEIEDLRRLSAKEELSLNYLAKDEMVSKVLLGLQGYDDLILKGGTAINRGYLKNKRFSEDIDFDLIFKGTVKEAIPRTREIISKLTGFEIAGPRIMNETIRYDLYYLNPLNQKDRIQLEFRVKKKAAHYLKTIVNFGFVPADAVLLNVYELEEMIRQKIECVLNRKEGKDFFDLHYLLDLPHQPIKISKEEKEKIFQRINLSPAEVRAMANIINHYLPRNARPNWEIFLMELEEKIRKMF